MGIDLSVAAADGYPLAVTRFEPERKPWGSVVVAGAMGVRRDFYAPFARHLADQGLHVLTFDYRGVGGSRRGRLADLDASVSDWAVKDLNAMLHEAHRAAPNLPLAVVGHSLGGQILPIAPDNGMVEALIAVTAGSGFYRHNDRMPLQVRIFFHLAIPLLTPLFGYFPGRALRMVGDMPRSVAYQWRRWCLSPEYLLSEGEGAKRAYERVTAPILSLSFEDDAFITRRAVESLNGFLPNARLTHRHLAPADIGEARIGHFGYFSDRIRGTLWRDSVDWLRSALQAA